MINSKNQNIPFPMVEYPIERSKKPRATGITMMMDWGLTQHRAEDAMTLLAPYIDLVKIVVGTARLYPRDYLSTKLNTYKANNVKPFLGGQFSEYVFATKGWEGMTPFFDEAKAIGFDALEISDNCIPLTDEERTRMIQTAIDSGMEVHVEVGSKVEMQSSEKLIKQANICLEAGADLVLVEGAELIKDGSPYESFIKELKAGMDLKATLFELTGPWIKDITLSDVHQLKRFLIDQFGPDVNLANVMPDDALETEALRCGLSVTGPGVTSNNI